MIRSWLPGMKCLVCALLALALPLSASGAVATAAVRAQCHSLALEAAVAVTTNEKAACAYFTTCDDGNGMPRFDTLPDGLMRMSDELRPRPGQPGIYDVDYVLVSEADELIEYGTWMLRLATEDADSNGLPDFAQWERPGGSEITGLFQSDWPQTAEADILGRLERQANAAQGSFGVTAWRSNGAIFISGSYSLPLLEGEVTYSPTQPTQLTFRVSATLAGRSSVLTGTARCWLVSSNEIALGQLVLRDPVGRARTALPTTLRRVNTQFLGDLEFIDGHPETSWKDYTSWRLVISDLNDANTNSVPDLADPDGIADVAPPLVRITQPAQGVVVTEPKVQLSGFARDNLGVALVEYRLGSAEFLPATGTTQWSADITLAPGTNVLEVRAVDAKGNVSSTARRRIVHLVHAPLIAQVNGEGALTPHGPGKRLALGRSYSLRAVAHPGHIFSHWSGDVAGAGPQLRFTMQSNLTIVANFVPNPFLNLAGTYEGLFAETGTNRAESAGLLRLAVRANGVFTGRLMSYGKTATLTGRFDARGESRAAIRRGDAVLYADLKLDVDSDSGQLKGVLTSPGWVANLLAHRHVPPGAETHVAGRYTIRLMGAGDGSHAPAGDGYATVVVSTNGRVRLAGKLADGTAFSSGASLSRSGAWPLYLAPYRGKGLVMSWLQCTSPADIPETRAAWLRPPSVMAKQFAAGFDLNVTVAGSAYGGSNSVAPFARALVIASAGGLAAPLTNQVALTADHRLLAEDRRLVSLKLNITSGVFSGSFLAGDTTYRAEGVLLAKQNIGTGFFLTAAAGGSIRLAPAP